jgi:hypothetical protein
MSFIMVHHFLDLEVVDTLAEQKLVLQSTSKIW